MNSEEKTYDLAVIGAGPAGAHLAARMAKSGFSVALLDPKAPWEKPCGGGITHKAWSMFPYLGESSLNFHEVFASAQISQTGRFFVIDQGHALLMTSRTKLSRLMLERARDRGAVHLKLQAKAVIDQGPVKTIGTADGINVHARYVVGADGVMSMVRRRFVGRLPKERVMTALWGQIEGGPNDPTLIQVSPFPGYCWGFAKRNLLSVGVGALEPGHDLDAELDRFLEKFFPGRKPVGPRRRALLPYMKGKGAFREPRVGPGWALVGDAAGFCDTLTGEGILYAVWSAELLAQALIKGRPEQYDRAWRKAFGIHLVAGAFMAKKMFSSDNIDRFFTAITVCPAFRNVFMDFVWNQPPYHKLAARLIAAIPRSYLQWRRFMAQGGRLRPEMLGPFSGLAKKIGVTEP
jgi:geranylgeranyl diphosphate/geranylgeranyl-bacteriochlorophyllide a reductase